MKKIFTLALALMGLTTVANAATDDDLEVIKHSYVLVCDDYTNNGTAGLDKGTLFGDNHFLAVKALNAATNKGTIDLSVADGTIVTEEMAQKYGEYGAHLNSLRVKAGDDVIRVKLTEGSKIIILSDRNNTDRYPELVDASTGNAVEGTIIKDGVINPTGAKDINVSKYETTVHDGGTYNIIAHGGSQVFISYVIVETVEAPGTPTVKVGDQTFEGGLWFREVTCKPNDATEEGSDEKIPTVVTYTTDGTTPTAASPVYTQPIKCYQNMTVKFQAFLDFGDGKPNNEFACDGADVDANVDFRFDAPAIEADGATFAIVSPYAEQNGTNWYALNGGEAVVGNGATLTESATVSAYTVIANGEYATFTSNSTSKDVYVLNPIKEKKTIQVIAGDVILDEEATASSTTGEVYKIENGEISADKMDFFVKNLTFKAITDEQYQVPAGNARYIQMSNTNITFLVAEGDSVTVKVICSKNSCKNIDAEDAAADKLVNGCTPDRCCYVNVSGTNYCHLDSEGGVAADLTIHEDANIIEFGLKGAEGGSFFTFQKYSGTGNIMIASIEITPAEASGISSVNAAANTNGVRYNVVGQKVAEGYKGLVITNGQKMIQK